MAFNPRLNVASANELMLRTAYARHLQQCEQCRHVLYLRKSNTHELEGCTIGEWDREEWQIAAQRVRDLTR